MSKKAKITVAAVIAVISFGGLAPAASARRSVGENMGIAVERLGRGADRLVGNVGENVERDVLRLGQAIERTFNPR